MAKKPSLEAVYDAQEDELAPTVSLPRLPEDGPPLPGFEMEDVPFTGLAAGDGRPFPAQEKATHELWPSPEAQDEREQSDGVEDLGHPEIASSASAARPALNLPANIRYESRIQVMEAFQYRGNFRDAPDWVDRNWLSYADTDPLRGIAAGPALRVPLPGGTAIARVGDYITQESVTIDQFALPEIRLGVWPKESFAKMFLPVQVEQHKTFSVTSTLPRTSVRA